MHNYAVAHNAHLRIAAHLAVLHICAGNGAHAAYLERVPHAYAAQLNFLEHGLEQALHSILDILYRVIDYAVKSYIHVFLFGQGPCAGVGAHVEADNDCVGRGCKYNVGVGYSADCAMDAPYAHLIV